jgi:hypothetical protein
MQPQARYRNRLRVWRLARNPSPDYSIVAPGSENLRPMPQKVFCNAVVQFAEVGAALNFARLTPKIEIVSAVGHVRFVP